MGATGSMLESGGFSAPHQWHTVDYIDGIKVLEKKDEKSRVSLPPRSNTPGATYISFRKDGTFDQIRKYGENRKPEYDIDYGNHKGKIYLHIHFYENGERSKNPMPLKSGDKLYEKYKNAFKGVKWWRV